MLNDNRNPLNPLERVKKLKEIPLIRDMNYLMTQVTELEDAFFMNPWSGAKFLMGHKESIVVFETVRGIAGPEDIQATAGLYRELCDALKTNFAACVMNIHAVPKMPGLVGYIFGVEALYSVAQSGATSELRCKFYDSSDGHPTPSQQTESVLVSAWEERIKEPFESFMKRLFIPIEV